MNINIESKINKSDFVIIPVFEETKGFDLSIKKIIGHSFPKIKESFKGELNQIYQIPSGFFGFSGIVLLGLGKQKFSDSEKRQKSISLVAKIAQKNKSKNVSIVSITPNTQRFIKDFILGFTKGSYAFNEYITEEDKKFFLVENLKLVGFGVKYKKEIEEIKDICKSIEFAKNLGNHPPSTLTPNELSIWALGVGQEFPKVKVEVYNKAQISSMGMGGLIGVSMGSNEEPRFIVMEFFNNPKSKEKIVYIGKGVTFDTGGISIKPSTDMHEMKFDMMGAAAVISAMRGVAALDLKVNLVVLVPTTENKPGTEAIRPGDVLKMHNGMTVEVIDTDAEGRLILADALSYAKKYKPSLVVDLATLTGACIVAIGENYAGSFCRNWNIEENIINIGKSVGERIWPLPLDDDFGNEMKSIVADLKNLGKRWGGASSAAAFLERFTDYPWIHLDIAGVSWKDSSEFNHDGATGWGVSTLIELAKKKSK